MSAKERILANRAQQVLALPAVKPLKTMPVTEGMKKAAASKQPSGGKAPVVLTYSPTIHLSGQATERDRADFMKLLKQHKDEILRMLDSHKDGQERMAW